jgi:hypothetical protein
MLKKRTSQARLEFLFLRLRRKGEEGGIAIVRHYSELLK